MNDNNELETGTGIEHEHTQDDALARKIATDHIKEDPHYYSKLKAAGLDEDNSDDKNWEDYKKTHGEEEIEDAYGQKVKVKDLGWHKPQGKRMGQNVPELRETDVSECDGPEMPAVGIVKVSAEPCLSTGATAQSKLTSSGLGKAGVPKPLASDKLNAPETKLVRGNTIASTKTTPLSGNTITTDKSVDPMDHFGSAIVGLSEGG